MSTNVGLWIDHRKAIVVAITEQGEKIEEIVSGVEKQLQRAGDRPLEGDYEVVQVPADDSRKREALPTPSKRFYATSEYLLCCCHYSYSGC